MIWKALIILLLLPQIASLPLGLHGNSSQLLSPNAIISASIVVPPKNLPLLQTLVENHTVLDKSQVQKLFIPEAQIENITNYLEKFGLNVTTYLNVIVASGKVSALERALNGQFIITRLQGKTVYQFLGSPSFDAIVIGTNITSLLFERPQFLINVTQAAAYNSVSIKDLWRAYNITPLLQKGINGSGVNIGIIDFGGDPYIIQQLYSFDKANNLPNPPFFEISPIGPYNPNDGIASGWAMEISLDVEVAHATAPGAGIILYVVNLNYPLQAAIAYIDSQDNVSVVSQSFGIPELYVDLGYLPLSFVQSLIYEYWLGEVEGITFVAASGDAGGNGYNFFLSTFGNLNIPASIPYVLAVGGTSLFANDNQTYQTAWAGQSIFGATTGGYSSIFPAPTYQGINGFRMVPDVVADANPYTGISILYYYNQTILVGGTSVASPIVSGIIALASQIGGRFGFINPLIYDLKGTKAIVPVKLGYNTPYIANSTLNPVTGLGYINAGYFVYLISKPNSYITVAATNTTYLDNQTVKVVAYLHNVQGTPRGYVYNGSNIIEEFPLTFNGTAWIGEFRAQGSGVEEIIVSASGVSGFTYITVGYQVEFLLPPIAVFPVPEDIPVLIETFYPNGKLANSSPTTTLYVYRVSNQTQLHLTYKYNLSPGIIINITQYGITIKPSTAVLTGYINFSNLHTLAGTYMLKLKDAFGFSEFVLGYYVVPYVYPSIITEPQIIALGQNFTVVVFEEGYGNPNITVELVNIQGKPIYSTAVNEVSYNGLSYYVSEISLPKDIPPGYYYIIAKAVYDNDTYVSEGEGETQIYVTNSTLNVNVLVQPLAYENQTVEIRANIDYANGTPVTLGTFVAIVIPSYLNYYYDQLSSDFVVPLSYHNGTWIGYVQIPSGLEGNLLGYSPYGISGEWNILIEGISANWFPTDTNTYLSWSSLNLYPVNYNSKIIVLPYVYVNYFNGTVAYDMYIKDAVITNHNATFIDSLIENLTVVNGTAYLINSQVIHKYVINSKIYTITKESNTTIQTQTVTYITSYISPKNLTLKMTFLTYEIVAFIIGIIALFILFRRTST